MAVDDRQMRRALDLPITCKLKALFYAELRLKLGAASKGLKWAFYIQFILSLTLSLSDLNYFSHM